MGSAINLCILAVGDELLGGKVLDTNLAAAAKLLEPAGYRIALHLTASDAPGALASLLGGVLRGDFDAATGVGGRIAGVIVCGGLGPTEDDRTRAEVAAALGVELEFRDAAWQRIVAHFNRRGATPVANNRRQAFFPATSLELPNAFGSAPAFHDQRGERALWVLPGVPREFVGLLEHAVLPALRQALPAAPAANSTVTLRFFGMPESTLDAWVLSHLPQHAVPDYHIYFHELELEVVLPAEQQALAALAATELREKFLGVGSANLSTRLVALAAEKQLHIVIAESVTGGLATSLLIEVPGASQVLAGAWVTYTDEWKRRELGVPDDILARFGAVSEECAASMAEGARSSSSADLAVAITGIAGPSGGTPDRPVGLTYVAIANARNPAQPLVKRFQFAGDRAMNRIYAAKQALFALYRQIMNW
ncbi:MAG: nicotinamide-nucleotide amidohydrolase family protein [Planctomycetota bacterium]